MTTMTFCGYEDCGAPVCKNDAAWCSPLCRKPYCSAVCQATDFPKHSETCGAYQADEKAMASLAEKHGITKDRFLVAAALLGTGDGATRAIMAEVTPLQVRCGSPRERQIHDQACKQTAGRDMRAALQKARRTPNAKKEAAKLLALTKMAAKAAVKAAAELHAVAKTLSKQANVRTHV